MDKNRIQRNIPKHYAFTFFSNINFTSGLWMIFLSKNGFSLIELGLLESFFHVGSIFFEIPSGALADLIGRKFCRIASKLAILISLLIMYFTESFFLQSCGFVICAFSYNLESGAGEALLYDSLLILKKEEIYKKIAGYVELFFQAGMIISFALGGLMATVAGYSTVFLFSFFAAIIALFIAVSFAEPERKSIIFDEKSNYKIKRLSSFFKILGKSIKLLKDRPRILYLIIFSETIFTFTTALFFFLQNYFKEIVGINETRIGIIYSATALFSAISSIFASKIEKSIGQKRLLIFLPALLCVCLWGISITNIKAIFFIFTGFIEGVLVVVISDYLNKMIPSEIRATVLSFQSVCFSIVMIVLFPLIGIVAEKFSFKESFIFMALIATILSMVTIFKMRDS